jgi:hypothetical protein
MDLGSFEEGVLCLVDGWMERKEAKKGGCFDI